MELRTVCEPKFNCLQSEINANYCTRLVEILSDDQYKTITSGLKADLRSILGRVYSIENFLVEFTNNSTVLKP